MDKEKVNSQSRIEQQLQLLQEGQAEMKEVLEEVKEGQDEIKERLFDLGLPGSGYGVLTIDES